jgi:hypothetical protein
VVPFLWCWRSWGHWRRTGGAKRDAQCRGTWQREACRRRTARGRFVGRKGRWGRQRQRFPRRQRRRRWQRQLGMYRRGRRHHRLPRRWRPARLDAARHGIHKLPALKWAAWNDIRPRRTAEDWAAALRGSAIRQRGGNRGEPDGRAKNQAGDKYSDERFLAHATVPFGEPHGPVQAGRTIAGSSPRKKTDCPVYV